MDEPPKNLKEMLSEAKDTSELMVDLAYAALYYNAIDIAEELGRLEDRLNALVFDMRVLCLIAARSRRDAEEMASVLNVISAIDKIAESAIDIGNIVIRRLGIPSGLRADLGEAEEVVTRCRVHGDSTMDGTSLVDLQLPIEASMRVIGIRRGDDWEFDPRGDTVLVEDDILFCRGAPEGVAEVRRLAGAPELEMEEPEPAELELTDLGRAIDVLVDMKDTSELCVGLAYSAVLFDDAGLAAEVSRLEDRMDDMREQLELWVLRASRDMIDPSVLRGVLHLGVASETIADAAREMVWLVEQDEEVHPVFAAALRDSDEVVMRAVVGATSTADGRSLQELSVEMETGVYLLAVLRDGRWRYRPRGSMRLQGGDEVIGVGPPEGTALLAEMCGDAELLEAIEDAEAS